MWPWRTLIGIGALSLVAVLGYAVMNSFLGCIFVCSGGFAGACVVWASQADARAVRGKAALNAMLDEKAPGQKSLRELGW